MKENAYKAQYNGGWLPLGYDVDQDKHYIINEQEAFAVKLIYDLCLKHVSYADIAEELNNHGYKTRRGIAFVKTSIYEILRNEKYCGTYVYNETPKKIAGKRNNRIKNQAEDIIRIEDAIPAIISRSDWEAVQLLLDGRKCSPRTSTSMTYILAGLLRCGECGSAMIGQSTFKNRNGEKHYTYYYQCNKSRRTRECSYKKLYNKEHIEGKILDFIEQTKNMPNLINELWKEVQKAIRNKDHETISLEKQLKEVEKIIKNYMQAIEKGAAMDLIIEKLNEAGRQKKYLVTRLAEKKSPLEAITKQDIINQVSFFQSVIVNRDDLEECKKIVADCIKSATVLNNNLDIIYQHHLVGAAIVGVGEGT
ncbi:MAG: recombinase family protein [Syntrophomonadaceae bacterium]|nr:recombinase family protein [Syntrophomonadaceae bacterium]